MHQTIDTLESRLDHILAAPKDGGTIEMIVVRPAVDAREARTEGVLDVDAGLIGDNWSARGNENTDDGRADPLAQLTLMNSRVAEAVGGDRDRWPLAGDQIYVDMDLSIENLPAGSRLQVGSAVIEISSKPHTGCAKFSSRFGAEALRFVNVGRGREGRFRGVNAIVTESGAFAVGDEIRKV